MSNLYYIAYGSNLHPLRLRERIGDCTLIGPVVLDGYQLEFSKLGEDGSGKCTINPAGKTDQTLAVLYEIGSGRKSTLDEFEGSGYQTKQFQVICDGQSYTAHCYVARPQFISATARPFDWYKELVILGAIHHRFGDAYVTQIDNTIAVIDKNRRRRQKNNDLIQKLRLSQVSGR